MINEQFVKEYTPFISKIIYLITRDQSKVEEVVVHAFTLFSQDRKAITTPSKLQSNLIYYTVKALEAYYKSAYYQKLRWKAIFDTGERFNNHSFDNDLSYSVLKLKRPLREVVTLYYYTQLTTSEIAKLLNLTQGEVQRHLIKATQQMNKPIFEEDLGVQKPALDAFLNEWDEFTEYRALHILDAVQQNEVVPLIKPKSNWKRNLFGLGILLVLIVGVAIFEIIQPNNPLEADMVKEPVQAMDVKNHVLLDILPAEMTSSGVLIPTDLTEEIAKLEIYYLQSYFVSMERAEIDGKSNSRTIFEKIYYLDKNNYVYDLEEIEKRLLHISLQFKVLSQRADYKEFFRILKEDYFITEAEYEKYYLTHKMLDNYFTDIISRNSTMDEEFYSEQHNIIEEFNAIVGEDLEKSYNDLQKKEMAYKNSLTRINDLSLIPFNTEKTGFEFFYNEDGEIIIVDPNVSWYDDYSVEDDVINYPYKFDLEYNFGQPINRLSLPSYIEFLQQEYEKLTDKRILQMLTIYKMIEKSI